MAFSHQVLLPRQSTAVSTSNPRTTMLAHPATIACHPPSSSLQLHPIRQCLVACQLIKKAAPSQHQVTEPSSAEAVEYAPSPYVSSCISRRRHMLLLGTATLVPEISFQPENAAASIVDEDIATSVFDATRPSVVSVAISRKGENLGTGSGLVWTQDGYIVTNYHVISKIDNSSDVLTVVAQTKDGGTRSMTARVVGSDTMNDLAVLKTEEEGLQPARFGTAADLKVGQSVYACGFPYGLPASLSSGVVSGLNRSIPSPVGTRIYGTIQTDASINGGNSGGPLLDSAARVVGIAVATYSRSGSGRGSGVNFALPIDKVMKVVPQLIVYGNASGKRV